MVITRSLNLLPLEIRNFTPSSLVPLTLLHVRGRYEVELAIMLRGRYEVELAIMMTKALDPRA